MPAKAKGVAPKRIFESTLASLAIEGLKPSNYAIDLCNKRAAGKITCKQAVDLLKKKYSNKAGD